MTSPKSKQLLPARRAFTLVELLISMAIICLIMIMLVQVTGATQRLWVDGRSKASEFRESRTAFESMTRQIGQATLNTYWDYDTPSLPSKYIRQSDLHFVVDQASNLLQLGDPTPTHAIFFQGPIGVDEQKSNDILDDTINAWGYYLDYGSDLSLRPSFLADGQRIPGRIRSRLMEFRQPSERLQVFGLNLRGMTSTTRSDYYTWFSGSTDSNIVTYSSHPIAENIIALVISPRLSLPLKGGQPDPAEYTTVAPNYLYDSREFQWNTASDPRVQLSRNQLTPAVQVTMVAIDEIGVQRLGNRAATLVDPTWFKQVSSYPTDLKSLTDLLTNNHANYRVFNANVTIRNSKWSQ